jgi:antibiotic biosynthesis monooxygenase (ABM) superfamily enzyme
MDGIPALLQAISTVIPAITLTWLVIPGIRPFLCGWLYAARAAERLDG